MRDKGSWCPVKAIVEGMAFDAKPGGLVLPDFPEAANGALVMIPLHRENDEPVRSAGPIEAAEVKGGAPEVGPESELVGFIRMKKMLSQIFTLLLAMNGEI